MRLANSVHLCCVVACVQTQFNKLRGICVAAEQGMRSLVQRLSLALEAPISIGPSVQALVHDAIPSSAGQAGGSGSRLTSAGGHSSMSGGHGAEALRRSGAGSLGSAGHHRRPSKDHGMENIAQQSALASKAQRCAAVLWCRAVWQLGHCGLLACCTWYYHTWFAAHQLVQKPAHKRS